MEQIYKREEDIESIEQLLDTHIYSIHERANPAPVFARNVSESRYGGVKEYSRFHYIALSYVGTHISPQLKQYLIEDVGTIDGVGWREDDFGYSKEQYEQWLQITKENFIKDN